MMVGQLLVRGLLAGVLAGFLVFLVGRTYGEVPFDKAITYESDRDQAKADTEYKAEVDKAKAAGKPIPAKPVEAPDLFSRDTQKNLGLPVGSLVVGAALGGIFSLLFSFVYGRLWTLGPRGTAAVLAVFGFLSVFLIPNLKYPSNPPGTSVADTIGSRTALYFSMILLSVIALVLAIMLRARLEKRVGAWNASIAAGLAYVFLVGFVMLLMPVVMETPADFSAVVMWNFRLATIGMQVVMYATIGLLFGALAERLIAREKITGVGDGRRSYGSTTSRQV